MRVFTLSNGDTRCDKLKPQQLENTLQANPDFPTDSQWREYLHHPEHCESGATWLRDNLPTNDGKVQGGYRGRNMLVLYIEHSIAAGILTIVVGISATSSSLVWATLKNDTSGGFAIGAFIVGLAGFMPWIMYWTR